MRAVLVLILLFSAGLVNAADLEIPTGEEVVIKAVNTSCESDHYPLLSFGHPNYDYFLPSTAALHNVSYTIHGQHLNKLMNTTKAVLTSSCQPIYCFYIQTRRWDKSDYSVYKQFDGGRRVVVATGLSKSAANEFNEKLKADKKCAMGWKSGGTLYK